MKAPSPARDVGEKAPEKLRKARAKVGKGGAKVGDKAPAAPALLAAKPVKPNAAAVRKALSTRDEMAPSLAQFVREDHKLRESLVDDARPTPWWDSALRSALTLVSVGARVVRRYVRRMDEDERKERDTFVPV